jgi:hypothetical protein
MGQPVHEISAVPLRKQPDCNKLNNPTLNHLDRTKQAGPGPRWTDMGQGKTLPPAL